MNTLLWIGQSIIAAMFIAGGLFKILVSREQMIPKQPYVQDYSSLQIKFIGVAEILGAIGIIVPIATDILPILTPLAAAGLCIIMIFAARLHFRRKENAKVVIIVLMLVVTSYIAYERL